jgi:hypothetical protein
MGQRREMHMEPWEHIAKSFDIVMGAAKPLPKAPRVDGEILVEDEFCELRVEYEVLDYGNEYDAPLARAVAIYGNFGGNEFPIPLRAFTPAHLAKLDILAADDVDAQS